jgi:hypothetical protein
LVKNTAQLNKLFALSNLWVVRKKLFRCLMMSAPAQRATAKVKSLSGHPTGVKSVNQKKKISSDDFLSINSRFCGGNSEFS